VSRRLEVTYARVLRYDRNVSETRPHPKSGHSGLRAGR
jgi:hypothetical protein